MIVQAQRILPVVIRRDTRLYLGKNPCSSCAGTCVGIVWMCNPGTTMGPPIWGPCNPDPTLRRVGDIFNQANALAIAGGKEGVGNNDYLQILNLHYVVDSDPTSGWITANSMMPSYTELPQSHVNFCWLAWGQNTQPQFVTSALAMLAGASISKIFHFDEKTKTIVSGAPIPPSWPMHPLRPVSRIDLSKISSYIATCL